MAVHTQTETAAGGTQVEAAFRAHQRLVWGLGYRMLGSAADADDLVQEVFARVLTRPPDGRSPLRPWLVAVTMNLARDLLRRRKRTRYHGEWLPGPVDGDGGAGALAAELAGGPATEPSALEPPGLGTEGRYDLMESVSYAFLLALEALSPLGRAALLLCDVFDYAAAEAAEVLGLTENHVRVLCHRARKQMAGYDGARRRPSGELTERTRNALMEFLGALASKDAARLEALLAEDVRDRSDGGGVYSAAQHPVVGRDRVLRLFLGLTSGARGQGYSGVQLREINGEPAAVFERPAPPPRWAPRLIIRVELDGSGRICEIHSVLAPAKLTAIAPL
ncbi:MAG: sigma-70 family RNA polymerase sigma factor [Deltaproteobacteria bacterium]|nr:sigma-70 family RNA polymerase sigma factor [Deltaproteobacteria bacterium]